MVKFYDSFSSLISMIKDGQYDGDDDQSIYHFGCTHNFAAFIQIAQNLRFSLNRLPGLLEMLQRAESEGRVSWRSSGYDPYAEMVRFQRTLERAREMGAEIPYWNLNSEHHDASTNLSAMRNFLGTSVEFPSLRRYS